MDLELKRLFYKRARAKFNSYLDVKYVTPLFDVDSEKAVRIVFRLENSFEEMESHFEDFKLAQR